MLLSVCPASLRQKLKLAPETRGAGALGCECGTDDGEHRTRPRTPPQSAGCPWRPTLKPSVHTSTTWHTYLIEVCQDPQLGAHFWYGFLKLLDPPVLFLLLRCCHSPLALKNQKHQIKDSHCFYLFLTVSTNCSNPLQNTQQRCHLT